MDKHTEYIAIQMELVLLMQHKVCWNDRKDIGQAMSHARWEWQSHLKEMEQLHPCAANVGSAPEA